MASADFLRFVVTVGFKSDFHPSARSPRVRTLSFSPCVCHIYCKQFRVVFGLQLVRQPYPCFQPYVISVRQTRDLPPSSFRFHLTMDTLDLSYTLPTTRACSGLSPVRLRPCWAHPKEAVTENPVTASLYVCLI